MFPLLLACAGSKDIDGIWAIVIAPTPDPECSESISHNFTDGFVQDEDDESTAPFEADQDTEQSDALQLIQITRHSKREATMLRASRAYPGELGEGGGWNFEWEGNEVTTITQTHRDGYDYAADIDVTLTTSVTLRKDGDTISGLWTTTTHTVSGYTETDAWSAEITEIGEKGQIPSSQYLVRDAGGTIRPVDNERDFAECSGTECELDLDITCGTDREYTGYRTGYEEEDAYGHLGNAGQPAGS